MAKNRPGKGAGKAHEGRSSPPSSTRNERSQGARNSAPTRNPKTGKGNVGSRKGGGLH